MAELNCEACAEIKDKIPELAVNGFDETMCTSLKNDTGLKPSVGHNDCTDLDLMNDCLVGNMETELDAYDVCDWKDYMKAFVGNVWTTLKGIICTICGLWTNIHNLWEFSKSYRLKKEGSTIYLEAADGRHGEVPDDDTKYDLSINGNVLKLTGSDGTVDNVTISTQDTWKPNTVSDEGYVAKGSGHVNQIWATDAYGNPAWRNKDVIDGSAFIKYYRDLGADDSVPYWENVSDNFERTLDIYMDSHGASSGSQSADRDYVVIISNCTNYVGFQEIHGYVSYYSSGDNRSASVIRDHQAQHPVIFTSSADQTFANFSWTTSGAVLLKAGEHIKVNFFVTTARKGNAQDGDNTRPKIRLHQFVLIWIPVSVQAISPT